MHHAPFASGFTRGFPPKTNGKSRSPHRLVCCRVNRHGWRKLEAHKLRFEGKSQFRIQWDDRHLLASSLHPRRCDGGYFPAEVDSVDGIDREVLFTIDNLFACNGGGTIRLTGLSAK